MVSVAKLDILISYIIIGAGAYAGCAYCLHRGEHSKILQKIIYPGNRYFLQKNDVLRDDSTNFPQKIPDSNGPPSLKTTTYINAANTAYVAASNKRDKSLLAQGSGCKGPYALQMLPLHDRISLQLIQCI